MSITVLLIKLHIKLLCCETKSSSFFLFFSAECKEARGYDEGHFVVCLLFIVETWIERCGGGVPFQPPLELNAL